MKLLIALTPGILIGCALVETWVSIVSRKQPAPSPTSVVHTRPSAPRSVIFTIPNKSTAVTTAGLAQMEMTAAAR